MKQQQKARSFTPSRYTNHKKKTRKSKKATTLYMINKWKRNLLSMYQEISLNYIGTINYTIRSTTNIESYVRGSHKYTSFFVRLIS